MSPLEYFKSHKIDSLTTILTFMILFFGFLIFFSASLGVLARYEAKFYGIIQNQFLFGICLGVFAYLVGAYFPRNFLKNLSPFIFALGVILCILVLIPGIGFEHGGARRWLSIAGVSFQPSEVLKFASILFLGWFNFKFWNKLTDVRFRLLPIVILFGGALLVLVEPDLGTTTVIISGIVSAFFITSARWKDVLIIGLVVLVTFGAFYFYYPHAKERINTFLNPTESLQGESYQAKQTRISLGAGGLFGDGYGKSIQKYHHLPEPVGDSIFAVIGEEFGFVGILVILGLILTLCIRLIILSEYHRDPFAKSILVGVPIIILVQTFLNSGSASGATPFTGVPLPLISHGSTSIILIMAMLGLCSQIAANKIIRR